MVISRADLKPYLLDLAFTQDLEAVPRGVHSSAQDWALVQGMAAQHRLEPMLHWRLGRMGPDPTIPETLRTAWADAFKRATLWSLVLQRELLLVHGVMERAGIPYLALKGAWLAFHVYPESKLRPLRDIDVLVHESDTELALRALLEAGYTGVGQSPSSLAVQMCHRKHLPPLRSPSDLINIELHYRLFDPDSEHPSDFELSLDDGFWQRRISRQLAGARMDFPSPTDQLLHLIVHAVYEHQFTNGPLLISDLGYLLQMEEIDWPAFWVRARRGGHARGAMLALGLIERYWGDLNIHWPGDMPLAGAEFAHLLDVTAQLMLRDVDASSSVRIVASMAGQASLGQRAAILLRKAFPPRFSIAAFYGMPADSPWVYFWYPVKWWFLLGKRVPEYLRSRHQHHIQAEVSLLTRVNDWLASEKQS